MREFYILPILLFLSFFNYIYASDVKVEQFICSKNIVNRKPVGISNNFPVDTGKIYCFTKVKSKNIPTYIYHVWYKDNIKIAEIKLNVKYNSYRTWSYKSISKNDIGNWRIELLDKDKNKLAETSFAIGVKDKDITLNSNTEVVSDMVSSENETVQRKTRNSNFSTTPDIESNENIKKPVKELTQVSKNKVLGEKVSYIEKNNQKIDDLPVKNFSINKENNNLSNLFYLVILIVFYILFFPTIYFFNRKTG